MDAHITKERLGNFLSYDWLKILGTILAAVAVVALLFTMISTRPTEAQQYYVYSYGGLQPAVDATTLGNRLEGKFSYDILDVGAENFENSAMGTAAFTARRGVLEGSAVFVADYAAEGEETTPFSTLASSGIAHPGEPREELGMFLDARVFLTDCESYLARFFGEDWRDAPALNEAEVRACFLARNGNDKRFKTDVQKEAGVKEEQARLEALRENYLYVLSHGFENGIDGENNLLSFATYKTDGYDTAEGHVDREYTVGYSLGKLSRLNQLYFYYDAEKQQATEKINLLLFNNGVSLTDLKYESMTLLRYLIENYA